MNPEFAAPPDLMNRFIETPFQYTVSRGGYVVEIHTNKPLQELAAHKVNEETPTLRWWIIQEDDSSPHRRPRTIDQDELLTIVGEDGSLTVIDRQSREAYSFTSQFCSVFKVIEEVCGSLTKT